MRKAAGALLLVAAAAMVLAVQAMSFGWETLAIDAWLAGFIGCVAGGIHLLAEG